MAYYLIDFENVKSRGMEGVELLTEEDTVCIFYSDNADSMTFDLHRKLNETKANIIYHKVAVGTKNALDFQLATYLGYLVCEQQREGIHPNYFIVTKDNGFTSLMVYWKAQGVPVRIIRNLLWGKNPAAEQNLLTEEEQETETVVTAAEDVTEQPQPAQPQPAQPEPTQPEPVEETKKPVQPKTERADAPEAPTLPEPVEETQEPVQPEPEKADVPEEPAEPETVDEPAQPVKKPSRKKSNTRKKSVAKTDDKTAEKKAAEKKPTEKKPAEKKPAEKKPAEEPDELTLAVEKVLTDQAIVPQVVKFIRQYKTKQGINNALNKEFKDSKRTSEIYSAIKPLIADKKGK